MPLHVYGNLLWSKSEEKRSYQKEAADQAVQVANTDPEKKLKTKQVPARDAKPLTATDQTLGWVGLVALKLSRNTDVNVAFNPSGNVYAINYQID